MKRNLSGLLVVCLLACQLPAWSQEKPKQEKIRKDPRLVLLIAVDQFRYDYLTRFRDEYKGGLDRLLRTGANFVNANLEH